MLISAMNNSLSAMNAFSTGVHGSAYNLANVNSGPSSSSGTETGVRPVVSRPVSAPAETGRVFGPSRTDVAREMVNLSVNQNAFDANAQVIRASDEMLGTLVDMIV